MRFLIFSLLLGATAQAQVTLSWDAPTEQQVVERTEPIQNLQGYNLWLLVGTVGEGTTSYEVPPQFLREGEMTFAATTVSDGAESAFSDHASKTLGPPVVIAEIAFVMVRIKDAVLLTPAGTVPLGTPCDSLQQLNGHFMVPSNEVTWSGTVNSITVYALCGYSE